MLFSLFGTRLEGWGAGTNFPLKFPETRLDNLYSIKSIGVILQGHLWREVPQRKWAPVGVSLDLPAATATPDGKGWRLGLNAKLCNSMLHWGVGCRGRRRKRKWDGRRRLQFPIPVPKFSLICMSESAFLAPRGTSFTSQVLGSEVHITTPARFHMGSGHRTEVLMPAKQEH